MEKEVKISREFSFIPDPDHEGRTKEIRHYRNEKLVARYGSVYDENGNVIGVRQLRVEDVAPLSLLEKVRKSIWKKPEKLDYLNWIGVINFIGTINRINRVGKIEVVEVLELLKEITKVKEITEIKDIGNLRVILTSDSFGFRMKEYNYLLNSGFESGDFSSWSPYLGYASITDTIAEFYHGKYGVKAIWSGSTVLPDLKQFIVPSPVSDNFELVFACRKILMHDSKVKVWIHYTDGTETVETLDLDSSWAYYRVNAIAGKNIFWIGLCNDSSVGEAGDIYYDDVMLLKV